MEALLGKSITKVSNGMNIRMDLDKRLSLDKDCNILLIGMNGSGRTKVIKDLIRQFEKDENTYLLLITSTASEYKTFPNLNIESAERVNDSYEVRDALNHMINVNNSKKIRTVIFVDDNFIMYKQNLLSFIENLSLISKVHNCLVISIWNRIQRIPLNILKSSSVLEIFKLYTTDASVNDHIKLKGLTDKILKTTLNFRRGQRILSVDNNLIMIESE